MHRGRSVLAADTGTEWHIEAWSVSSAGAPLAHDMYRPLSKAMEAWHFDLGNPPLESARKILDVAFDQTGRFNAIVFWFELQLGEGITMSTRPGSGGSFAHIWLQQNLAKNGACPAIQSVMILAALGLQRNAAALGLQRNAAACDIVS